MKGPSVSRLADLMLEQLARLDPGSAAPAEPEIKPVIFRRQPEAAPAPEDELLAEVDEMDDDKVEALLRQMASKGEEATG